jgi:hypothetical protein
MCACSADLPSSVISDISTGQRETASTDARALLLLHAGDLPTALWEYFLSWPPEFAFTGSCSNGGWCLLNLVGDVTIVCCSGPAP